MNQRAHHCPNCGERTDARSRYCSNCGAPLVSDSQEVRQQPGLDDQPRRWIAPVAVTVLILTGLIAGAWLFVESRPHDVVSVDTTTSTTAPNEPTTTVTTLRDLTPSEIAADFGDAVFRVETEGCGFEGVGTGFAISERTVITNWHVVVNDTTPVIRLRNGRTIEGRVLGWTEEPDVAVVELEEPVDIFVEWAGSGDLTEGQVLASMGYPLPDHEFSVIPGSVLSFVTEGSRRTAIRTDASVDRGSSGGPALTDAGTVAGVVTQIDLNLEGFQFVPLIVTYDELKSSIDTILEEPDRPEPDCGNELLAGTEEPPPHSEGDDYDYPDPAEPFWAVILLSLDVETNSAYEAVDRSTEYWDSGIPAEVLLSNDFGSLNPGYWVVYVREFVTEQDADAYCESITYLVGSCYSRYVSWDTSYR